MVEKFLYHLLLDDSFVWSWFIFCKWDWILVFCIENPWLSKEKTFISDRFYKDFLILWIHFIGVLLLIKLFLLIRIKAFIIRHNLRIDFLEFLRLIFFIFLIIVVVIVNIRILFKRLGQLEFCLTFRCNVKVVVCKIWIRDGYIIYWDLQFF